MKNKIFISLLVVLVLILVCRYIGGLPKTVSVPNASFSSAIWSISVDYKTVQNVHYENASGYPPSTATNVHEEFVNDYWDNDHDEWVGHYEYDYDNVEWAYFRTGTATGSDFNPVWTKDQQPGELLDASTFKHVYQITFVDSSGNEYYYQTDDLGEFQNFQYGGSFNLSVKEKQVVGYQFYDK